MSKTIQYSIDKKPAKNFNLSWRNVGKYEFLVDEDISPEGRLLKKAATIKTFKYSPSGNELKRQADITKKLHIGLNKVYEFYKKEDDEAKNKK